MLLGPFDDSLPIIRYTLGLSFDVITNGVFEDLIIKSWATEVVLRNAGCKLDYEIDSWSWLLKLSTWVSQYLDIPRRGFFALEFLVEWISYTVPIPLNYGVFLTDFTDCLPITFIDECGYISFFTQGVIVIRKL